MRSVRNVELQKRYNEQCCPRYRGDVQRNLPYQLNQDFEPTQNSLRRVHQFSRFRASGGLDLLCINWISRTRRLTSTKIPHSQETHISGFEDPCAVALCIDLVEVPQSDQCTTSDILLDVNLRHKANKAR